MLIMAIKKFYSCLTIFDKVNSLTFLLFLMSFLVSNYLFMMILSLILFITNIIYGWKDFRYRAIFFLFQLMILVFNYGKIIIVYFSNEYTSSFSVEVNTHILFTIGIVLFFNYLGFSILESKSQRNIINNNKNGPFILLKIIFVCSFFALCIKYVDAFIYINDNGYLSYYTDYISGYPKFFDQLANFYFPTFFCMCVLFKKKKDIFLFSGIYLLGCAITLLNGQRGTAMLGGCAWVIYIFIYDFRVNNKPMIKKKFVKLFICFLPLLIILLNSFNYLRYDSLENISLNPITSIGEFFYQNGISGDLIGYEKIHKDNLGNKIYTFFPVKQLLLDNSITRMLGLDFNEDLKPEELPYDSSSFARAISFTVLQERYLEGEGLGSNFIAETYHDFGYIGVAIISIIYGMIFVFCMRFFYKDYIIGCILLMMITRVFWAPRGEALNFLVYPFNSINILVLFLLRYCNKLMEVGLKICKK